MLSSLSRVCELRHLDVTHHLDVTQLRNSSRRGEARRVPISFGDDRVGDRPSDPDLRVVPGDPGLEVRVVVARDAVEHVGLVGEHTETVAEAIRDEELAVGDVVELVALPAAVGRRIGAQVDGDVEDRASHAAHQLRLTLLRVDAPQYALARTAVVLLDELRLDPELSELVGAKGLDEEAAFVAMDIRLDQDDALDLGRQAAEAHCFSVLPYWRS